MSIEVKVPVLPESVSDAVIAAWHKKAGDAVSRDENLLDLETDKVVLEVPSPVDGVIKEIKVEAGATVTSQQLIAVIEEGAAAAKSEEAPKQRSRRRPRRRSPHRRTSTPFRRVRASPLRRKASTRRRSRAPAAAAR